MPQKPSGKGALFMGKILGRGSLKMKCITPETLLIPWGRLDEYQRDISGLGFVLVARFLLGLLLIGFALGCQSTQFGGSSGKKTGGDNAQKADGAESSDEDGRGDQAEDPITGINKICLSKKAREYNITLVIDSSLSQQQSDPQNLRGAAATGFATAMAEFAQAEPRISVEAAVIGFSGTAHLGARSPSNLGQKGHGDIAQDVAELMEELGAGTNFEAGLIEAQKALLRMGALKNKQNQRNFVVFLTDGEPNRSDSGSVLDNLLNPNAIVTAIKGRIDTLVNELDVAVISIASGTDLTQDGIDLITSMAQPQDPQSLQDHRGAYIRADSADDLEGLAKQLGQAISGCKP
jgi:hypothetical protein